MGGIPSPGARQWAYTIAGKSLVGGFVLYDAWICLRLALPPTLSAPHALGVGPTFCSHTYRMAKEKETLIINDFKLPIFTKSLWALACIASTPMSCFFSLIELASLFLQSFVYLSVSIYITNKCL